jgi:hypothetical protein
MKYVFSTTLALALLATAPALAQDKIDVMTQNQYLGADLTPIIAALVAGDPIGANAAMIAALEEAAANDYPARSKQLAELIADRLPELVGLQEMFKFSCIDIDGECTVNSDCANFCLGGSFCWTPPTEGEGCDDPRIAGAFNDHLDLTLTELAGLGEVYMDVAQVDNLNTALPVDTDENFVPDILVSVLDRDVILAREDIEGSVEPVDFTEFQALGICLNPSAQGCNYQVIASAGGIDVQRGWVAVDYLTNGGTTYRFVDTHLEVQNPDPSNPLSPLVQRAQAQELIATLGATTPIGHKLIVVGDINSSPEDSPDAFPIDPPYAQFVTAGYTDAWDLRPGDEPGYSCCQLADLSNQESILNERIDVIFSIEVPSKVKKARVLGAKVSNKTPPPGLGLWPSDHGSVAAELQFE